VLSADVVEVDVDAIGHRAAHLLRHPGRPVVERLVDPELVEQPSR